MVLIHSLALGTIVRDEVKIEEITENRTIIVKNVENLLRKILTKNPWGEEYTLTILATNG